MSAAVADRALPLGVGPAGAIGDQLAAVADEQVADELPERTELAVAGVHQTGADVVPEPEIAAGRLGAPGPSLRPALIVLCRRVPELIVVDAGAGEVRLLAGRCGLDFANVLVDEVERVRAVAGTSMAANSRSMPNRSNRGPRLSTGIGLLQHVASG